MALSVHGVPSVKALTGAGYGFETDFRRYRSADHLRDGGGLPAGMAKRAALLAGIGFALYRRKIEFALRSP